MRRFIEQMSPQRHQQILDEGSAEKDIDELEKALNRMVLAHETSLADSEGHRPKADLGCIHCISSTVPANRNTGPCAYHAAKLLLDQLEMPLMRHG
jgi:hypothetical protein